MAISALVPSSFRGRLLLIFLAMTTIPLVISAYAFLTILSSSLRDENIEKLTFVRDAKQAELVQYLTFAVRQAESLTKSNVVRYSIGDFYGFSYAFRMIAATPDQAQATLQKLFSVTERDAEQQMLPTDGGAMLRSALEYANAHNRFHDEYANFVRTSEFDNLYLINAARRMVYSVEKDRYLGGDLGAGMATTPLGQLVDDILAAPADTKLMVRDFALDPTTGTFAAYVAVRIEFHQRVRGVAVFRLPAATVDRLVQAQGRERVSGKLFLVSSTNHFVSVPPDYRWPIGSQAVGRPTETTASGADVIEGGFDGRPALSAWTTLSFGDRTWRLSSEVPTREAFADADTLTRFILGLAALSLPIVFWLSLVLSRTFAASLGNLTDAAESIAAGDLERDMPDIRKPNELARLATSFRRMRAAVREQLTLISQKNAELERQVRVIEEKNAALEEADRQKDTFVANTSHELRTPLNGIIGISTTLSAGAVGELAPAQRAQMELITFSARRLSRLVDDLLDLYRIRQGRMRLDIHPVHVATSIRNVLQVSQSMLRGQPVEIVVDIPEALPYVQADPVRFEQILYNLVGNAMKYTRGGIVSIDARATGDTVEVSVHDTGIGIATDSLERIFQPLERAADAEAGGFGLGLTIARQLAHAMHGTLRASSTLGKGSVFTFALPVAETVSEETTLALTDIVVPYRQALNGASVLQDSAETAIDDTPLVLVVDDEPINIQVLRNVLLPQGYAVCSAKSGTDALESVERRRPDLIILDVMMPGMGGLEVARRLRDRFSLLDLPIIMVTARSRTRDVIAGFENGANDYVIKPFVKDELLARVATLLAAAKAQAQALENADLKQEIDRRVQVEDALRLSQQRMAGLLDTVQAGIICVTDSGRITYANKAASKLANMRLLPGSTLVTDILTPDLVETVRRGVADEGQATLVEIPFGRPGRSVLVSAFDIEPDAGGGLALILTSDSARSRLEAPDMTQSLRSIIDTVGPELVQASETASANAMRHDFSRDHYRQTVVRVMTESLRLWRDATGKSKFDLAEESGIWRVSLDRSSLQARTLDKYLLLETLPEQPRWRDVIRTGEYVLDALEKQAPSDQLEELQSQLRTLRHQVRLMAESTG